MKKLKYLSALLLGTTVFASDLKLDRELETLQEHEAVQSTRIYNSPTQPSLVGAPAHRGRTEESGSIERLYSSRYSNSNSDDDQQYLVESSTRRHIALEHYYEFPFAALGRQFLFMKMFEWETNWQLKLQNSDPLREVLPPFGWTVLHTIHTEEDSLIPLLHECDMCGGHSEMTHRLTNTEAPREHSILNVDKTCARMMLMRSDFIYNFVLHRQ